MAVLNCFVVRFTTFNDDTKDINNTLCLYALKLFIKSYKSLPDN